MPRLLSMGHWPDTTHTQLTSVTSELDNHNCHCFYMNSLRRCSALIYLAYHAFPITCCTLDLEPQNLFLGLTEPKKRGNK